MKKTVLLLLFMISFMSATALSAFWENDKDKAKEYMAAGMNDEAIQRLEKRIHDKPTDAEAHLLLGSLYYERGSRGDAQKRFKSAYGLEPEYGERIADYCAEAGFARLDHLTKNPEPSLNGIDPTLKDLRGRIIGWSRTFVESSFDEAVKYNRSLQEKIAKRCLSYGNAFLKAGHNRTAEWLFSLTTKYDPSLSNEIKKLREKHKK